MTKVECPSCKSDRLLYVQETTEFHSIQFIDADGNVDLNEIEDTIPSATVDPHIYCEGCESVFTLKLKPLEG